MEESKRQKTMKYKGNLSTKLLFPQMMKCTYDRIVFNRQKGLSETMVKGNVFCLILGGTLFFDNLAHSHFH